MIIKKNRKCSRCGIKDFRVLCFHHKNRLEKDTEIAAMLAYGASLDSIKIEIKKCILLCGNCHMIEHYDERVKY